MSRAQGTGRTRTILLVAAVAAVGAVVGVVVAAPWDSGRSTHTRVGPALSFKAPPPAPTSRRHVVGAVPSTLTPDEITAVVAAHNRWRQKYGVTQQIAWSDALGSVAQEWANRMAASGNFDHRPQDPASPDYVPYGENLFTGGGSDLSSFTGAAAVDDWGSEEQFYDRNALTCADGQACGHFTQVVWATTTTVGCGKATDAAGQNIYWVCNYDPPGNLVGASPFTGKPAGG